MTGGFCRTLRAWRFAEAGHPVLLPAAVGVGKTHWPPPSSMGGICRRFSMHFIRPDKLFTWPRAARLDNFLEAKCAGSPPWTCSSSMTSRSRGWTPPRPTNSTNLWSSATSAIDAREYKPGGGHEWLAMVSDALLTHSAIDRLTRRPRRGHRRALRTPARSATRTSPLTKQEERKG